MTRARRWCEVLAAVGLSVSVLAACTVPGPESGPKPGPTPLAGAATVPAVAAPGLSTTPDEPVMTPVGPAAQCTSTRPLTGKGRLPLEAVFPGAESSAASDLMEVVPGADATDRARCPGELPADPLCGGLVPWTGLLPDAFVVASGARRLVQGYLLTMPRLAGNQAPPESSAGTKAVTFALVDLAAGDPAGLFQYLHAAFGACAGAKPAAVAGVAALGGTVRSQYGAGSAEVVLLRRGDHVVWASLDGSGWKAGEQRRALAVLVARLL